MKSRDELKVRPLQTINEAWEIARIRNTGREYMTHNTELISRRMQYHWFENTYEPAHELGDLHAFIGTVALRGAAYGMVQRKAEQYWLTGVVDPEFRGRGFGRALFQFLEGYVFDELNADKVMLDVREDNEAAKHLYDTLGYVEQERVDGLIVMSKERPDVQIA
jgi:ribosomal protein S18 acetylase RimI-like enzyme